MSMSWTPVGLSRTGTFNPAAETAVRELAKSTVDTAVREVAAATTEAAVRQTATTAAETVVREVAKSTVEAAVREAVASAPASESIHVKLPASGDARAAIQAALDAAATSSASYWSFLQPGAKTVVLPPGIHRISAPSDGNPSLVVPRGVSLRADYAELVFELPKTPTTKWAGILLHSKSALTFWRITASGSAPDAGHCYDAIRSYMQDNGNAVKGSAGAIIRGFPGAAYRGLGSYVVWLQDFGISYCSHAIVHGHSSGLVENGVYPYVTPTESNTEVVDHRRRPTDMWLQNLNISGVYGTAIVIGSAGGATKYNQVADTSGFTGGNLHVSHVVVEDVPAKVIEARELSQMLINDLHIEESGPPSGPMIDLNTIYGLTKVEGLRLNLSRLRATRNLAGERVYADPSCIFRVQNTQRFNLNGMYAYLYGEKNLAFSEHPNPSRDATFLKYRVSSIATDPSNKARLTAGNMLKRDNGSGVSTNEETY